MEAAVFAALPLAPEVEVEADASVVGAVGVAVTVGVVVGSSGIDGRTKALID